MKLTPDQNLQIHDVLERHLYEVHKQVQAFEKGLGLPETGLTDKELQSAMEFAKSQVRESISRLGAVPNAQG